MNKRKAVSVVLGVFFFGSLWGFIEASFGGWLYSQNTPYPSLYLTTIAIGILAASKVFLPYKWTGTGIGILAMFFKLVNVPFFACHLLAIFLLGFGFDVSYIMVTRFFPEKIKFPMIGLVGTYTGRSLFAVIITYVIKYHFWTEVGISKVIDYIFITGTISALLGSIAVPVSNRLAHSAISFSHTKLHTRFTKAAVLAASLIIWIFQLVL